MAVLAGPGLCEHDDELKHAGRSASGRHAVRGGRPGTAVAGGHNRLLLAPCPQVQVRLQELALQLTPLLDDRLRSWDGVPAAASVSCPMRQLKVFFASAKTSAVTSVSYGACIGLFLRPGTIGWHLRT
ncbi:hypothetical protein [Nonomuraea sp. SYSU D8015]|uniref:hypothetical protein n=1 Tax=Nonomuraea sp. SYSU D8015 TaxID=2593644 RepID=UPI0016604BA7|nr:hypothetical protein [Nonomuraea sp. SYSU D8015]